MELINKQQLLDRFIYSNGNLYYKISIGNKSIGDKAGYIKEDGYHRVYLNGKGYYLHRLIWLYFNDYFPREIDHINRNKSDNRIENLREVSHKENQSWMIGISLYDRKCRF